MHSIPSIFSDSTALRESWAEVMPPFSPFFPTGRDFPSSTTTTTTTLARLSITFKEQTRDTRDTRVYFFQKFLALPHIFFFSFSFLPLADKYRGTKNNTVYDRWRAFLTIEDVYGSDGDVIGRMTRSRVDHERDESLARAAIDTETVQEYIRYDGPVGQLIAMINGASH